MRRRILISLTLLLALCLVGDAIALFGLDRSIAQLSRLAESHRIQSMRSELNAGSLRLERDSQAHLLGKEPGETRLSDSIWRFRDSLRQCARCHHEPAVQADLDRVKDAFESWREASDVLYAPYREEDVDRAKEALLARADHVAVLTTTMVDRARNHLMARSDDVKASVHSAWVTLCVTLVVALVFGGAVAIHLHRRLTGPVAQLLEGIQRYRHGDIEADLSPKADEEFRRLGEAFDRAYRDLKSAQNSVLHAEKLAAVGRLSAGLAHEVANPLASISSIVQMMQRSPRSEADAKQLDLIMEHIGRISRIVRELLGFSRPAGEDERDRVDVGALLERGIGLVKYDKRAKGITIAFEPDAGPKHVRANAERLVVVFTNIMLNAFDALSGQADGEKTLKVSATRGDRRVVVRFEDNGPGMTEEQIENAFEPFYSTKEPGAGTGLGLWICYDTIRRYGGAIRIESRPGEGTAVILEIPSDGSRLGA